MLESSDSWDMLGWPSFPQAASFSLALAKDVDIKTSRLSSLLEKNKMKGFSERRILTFYYIVAIMSKEPVG